METTCTKATVCSSLRQPSESYGTAVGSGANVNASSKQSDRDTALYAAASTGNINPVKLLLG